MTEPLSRLQAALAGRYAIERELGRGGMATVYLARDLKHDRLVALKVLRPEFAAGLGLNRFFRDIQIAAKLTHPHILPLYDSGEAEGSLYCAMPYVEGESLRDRLTRDKQLPLDAALQITCEVADAMSYAHSQDIIHRDIKPENILFVAGHAVVSDFGVARAITALGRDQLTATGIAVGTPVYMSPEQAAGESELDGRSDIYSLACVLYEMLAGEPPYTGPTTQAIIAKRFADPIPSVRRLRDTVPPGIDQVLGRAMAQTPADRFMTAQEFAAALRRGREDGLEAGSRPTGLGDALRASGRQAIARHEWRNAFEAFTQADADGGLPPEDVERLADAAWWIGRIEDCIRQRERAYARYMEQGNPQRAAVVAIRLADDFFHKLAKSVGNGWLKRAERLVEGFPESIEHGVFLRLQGFLAFEVEHDLDAALPLAERTMDIARRFADRDLQALALHDLGRILVSKGQLSHGMAMLDEAMAAALSGELGPDATGRIYCNMISVCKTLEDYQRASQWIEAAEQWCELHTDSGFPGVCRVHRAELMRLRGAWKEAEAEAMRAASELRGFLVSAVSEAFYQVGEIRLRMGSLPRAEEAFRQAHELGRDPMPGLARTC